MTIKEITEIFLLFTLAMAMLVLWVGIIMGSVCGWLISIWWDKKEAFYKSVSMLPEPNLEEWETETSERAN